jgi:hypothetical protein
MAQFDEHINRTTCVFIGSYADGTQRCSRKKSASKATGYWHRLPTGPWFRNLLLTTLGPGSDTRLLSGLGQCENDQDFQRPHENLCIRGVAHISNYNCRWVDDNNISGIFDRQSLAQLGYYSNPLDAYEVNVESFTKLNLPFEKIIGRRSSRARDEGFKKATPSNPLFVPYWGSRDPSDVLLLGGEQTPPAGGELTPLVAAGGEQTPLVAAGAPRTPVGDGNSDLGNDLSDGDTGSDLGVDLDNGEGASDLRNDVGSDHFETDLDDNAPANAGIDNRIGARFGDAREIPCLLLPEAIVEMLEKQSWTKLVILTRWHPALFDNMDPRRTLVPGPTEGWPLLTAPVWDLAGKHRESNNVQGALPLKAEALRSFAEDVGDFAPALLDGGQKRK